MSKTLENVLTFEVDEILEFIEEQEELGTIQLQSFSWKTYTFYYKGDCQITVIDHENAPTHERRFSEWEDALNTVKELILSNYK